MEVISREAATVVHRPPFPKPYGWPEPVLVAVSNTAEILPVPQSLPNGDPLEYALARLMIETLYDNGYVLARAEPGEVPVPSALGERLKAEIEQVKELQPSGVMLSGWTWFEWGLQRALALLEGREEWGIAEASLRSRQAESAGEAAQS